MSSINSSAYAYSDLIIGGIAGVWGPLTTSYLTAIETPKAEQIRVQCLAGLLEPGQCLPSVRQLAKELVVNVNTVVRVYECLAAEGLVEMRHGEGTFVLPPSTALSLSPTMAAKHMLP